MAGRGSSACGGRGLASVRVPSGRWPGTPTLTTAHSPGASSRGSHECVARSGWSRASRPHSLMASSRVMSAAYAARGAADRAASRDGSGRGRGAALTRQPVPQRRRSRAPPARRRPRAGGGADHGARRGRTPAAPGACARRPRPSRRRPRCRRVRRASRARAWIRRLRAVHDGALPLAEAVATAATGDIWLFRGRSLADRAIQTVTNSPVNHVGMVVALDDLPPLLWHAELGHSLPDVWTGRRQRGVQLHHLEQAVATWTERYGQRAWTRALEGQLARAHEDRLMQVIDRFDGRPFPTTTGLARQWLTGRYRRSSTLETIYCAELVATTYQQMGLLPRRRPASWYDPGRFWSGDRIQLVPPFSLAPEVAVDVV